jgi:hypothetical protein
MSRVGAAGASVAAAPTTTVVSPAKAIGWSLFGTLGPQHIYAPNTQLVLYGVQLFNSTYADEGDPLSCPRRVGSQLPDPQVRVDGTNSCTRTTDGFRCPFVQRISLELTGTGSRR